MGLIKRTPVSEVAFADERKRGRSYSELIDGLDSVNPTARRMCARDLAEYPESVSDLLAALVVDEDVPTQEAIFSSLRKIGNKAVVDGLMPLLRSDHASIRNGAIEVLQTLPAHIEGQIVTLLNDQDSDVRIFAIDILQALAHPQTPVWVASVLKDETHINVVATAIDRLAEMGGPENIEDLEAVRARFPDVGYISFAVDTAIRRINDV